MRAGVQSSKTLGAGCYLSPVFLAAGFCLSVGGLTAKSWRIYKIYNCQRLQMCV